MQVKRQPWGKDKNKQDVGMASEILEILFHEVKRFCKVLWPQSSFLSDEKVLSILTGQLKELSGTLGNNRRAVQDYESIAFSSNAMVIRLDGGLHVNRKTLYFLLFGEKPENNPFLSHTPFGQIHDSSDSSEEYSTDIYLSSCLTDLLLRLGEISLPKDMSSARIELLQWDTIKRFTQQCLANLQTGTDKTKMLHDEISEEKTVNDLTATIWLKTYTISVVIQRAKNLPWMDVFRGVDAFCAIFLEGTELVYQTEIKRGYSEKQWNWESEGPFEFEVNETAYSKTISQYKLIAVLYDKDQARIFDFLIFYETDVSLIKWSPS